MDPYQSPYLPIVPRILPSQDSPKKIPMFDDRSQYVDNYPRSPYGSPTNFQPLSTKNQLANNEINHQDNPYSNQSLSPTSFDNSSPGRMKNRIYTEPLKDNSNDNIPTNSYSGYGYPPNYFNRPYDNIKRNSSEDKNNVCTNTVLAVFGIIIGLFAITALAISIYLLVRISTQSV
ncbi:unnamed protein product [Rotaria sp. Silwood1]|nr:unnamed protein product [Rotaria sp. Silwood1]CAF4645408.1 unnamed protein product [Rotaria sp. Silwood1]